MIQIYHNPRCKKSREGLAILEASGKEFEVINYLKNTPSKASLKEIVSLLKVPIIDLVRQNEAVWKAKYKGKTLSEDAILEALILHPKLIERPLVVHKNKAVIGRPPEKINSII